MYTKRRRKECDSNSKIYRITEMKLISFRSIQQLSIIFRFQGKVDIKLYIKNIHTW